MQSRARLNWSLANLTAPVLYTREPASLRKAKSLRSESSCSSQDIWVSLSLQWCLYALKTFNFHRIQLYLVIIFLELPSLEVLYLQQDQSHQQQ